MIHKAITPDDNKRLARRALEELYTGADLTALEELIHAEFVDHEPAHGDQPTGPASVQGTVERLHASFGELRFEIDDELAEGDKVVQRVTMSGRHSGPLMGREPSGKRFAVRHIYIWRIGDGKLIEHWGCRDDLGLLHQIGLLQPQ